MIATMLTGGKACWSGCGGWSRACGRDVDGVRRDVDGVRRDVDGVRRDLTAQIAAVNTRIDSILLADRGGKTP